ncbi:MAG: helix-turn-helix transcriptional regulator [Calditrichia bacterium]|nr:helix-turn-helix transcriptional regulator [Calditrichia bacterium]
MSSKLGLKIKQLLLQKDASQKELAEYCDITPQFVSYIIKGNKNASIKTIRKIATFLNTSIDYLYESTEQITDENVSGKTLPGGLEYLKNDAHLCREFSVTTGELNRLASHKFYKKNRDLTKAEWIEVLLLVRKLNI